MSSINIVSILIFILAMGITTIIYSFENTEIANSLYEGLSFLNIFLSSFLTILLSFLIYISYTAFRFNFKPDFVQKLTQIFDNFVKEYKIFMNFEDNIKELTNPLKMPSKPKNKM